ncbi:Pyridoxal phosphate-dependent transferase, major domain protein [Metarhizium robertsii ARSEF 23]|uniref:Pyridoxal phosphate-dependent transferase, major domain protein n=1 Tax=Metarhizium robertsii (strain ARSEF 23 / ATCC MYA-3075) TaxID=655844 RepID=E9FC50_METRA|nr:Pyridoxal phosphate-dependent transferase, major domain protein [Metarhizium robertsii ARSEF 23]EFY94725.2 Pyridoxal phosphate-dependent transferase, major domain protein [Metarhizium robertsii ARSEF 23]
MNIRTRLPNLVIETVRKQFPGLNKGLICLNNGSGALVHKGVMESRIDVRERAAQYVKLASFMNADPDEIAFGPSTTGLLRTLTNSLRPNLNADSEIIVSVLCHEAGITAWVALAKSLGISIKWWVPAGGMGNNRDPKLTLESLRPLLSSKTRLVCCGHVSNITGTIEPIKEIAELVHTVPGALICVDGVAWAPHRPIDVRKLNVDFYVFSWYKVFGPHIAQVYARRNVQQRYLTSLNHYFLDSSSLAVKLGLGNSCIELEHALVPIINYLVDEVGWDSIIAYEEVITRYLLDYLTANPDLYTVYGSRTSDPKTRVALISFSVNGLTSDKVANEIHEKSNCRLLTGDCWSPRTVHDILGLADDGIIRTSLTHYNTLDEMKIFTKKLDQVVHALKQ